MMAYQVDDIGSKVTHIYPQGTTVDTIVIEDTCIVCGSTYIGIREEVGQILAQHSIVHNKETESMTLESAMQNESNREQFESHMVALSMLYENHDELRITLVTELKLFLLHRVGIRLGGGGEV